MLKASSYIPWCTSSPYLSCSQDRRKRAPLINLSCFITYAYVNPKYYTIVMFEVSWLMIGAVKKLPAIGIWNIHETSSNLIVISPNGWWNEDVSLLHHSTKVFNSWLLSMVSKQSISWRRLWHPIFKLAILSNYLWIIVNYMCCCVFRTIDGLG